MDGWLRKSKLEPIEAMRKLNRDRSAKGMDPVSRSAFYRYVGGATRKNGRKTVPPEKLVHQDGEDETAR